MKLTSTVAKSGGSERRAGIERANIGLLDEKDIGAAAQAFVQLARADIDA